MVVEVDDPGAVIDDAPSRARMTAVVQVGYGDSSGLELTEVERPDVAHNEVLIAVRAAAVSPGDRAMVTGVPYINRMAASGLRRPSNPIPGFDVAGVVVDAGASVTRFAFGDAVFGTAAGSFAEYVAAAEDQLVSIPSGWSFEEAAAVPESGSVALRAVRDHAAIRPGQRIAVLGAGGGVGSHAIQIAKAFGASVTGICGSEKVAGVRELGADAAYDHHDHDLARAGHRYDVIIDTAGKAPLRELRRALTPTGRLVIVGADHSHRLTGGIGRWFRALIWSPFIRQQLHPFAAGPTTLDDLEELRDLMVRGDLVSVVDRTFPLAAAADAMRYLDHRTRPGKVVVVVRSAEHAAPSQAFAAMRR